MAAKHAHHGGSWKVAYADFVTAMMALFLVLWLTSQDQKIREAVQRSFNHPFASPTKASAGIIPNESTHAVKNESGNFDSASQVELEMLRRLNDDLNQSLNQGSEDQLKPPVRLEMTPEGLRINVFDRARQAIFEKNTDQLTPYGKWVVTTLAWHIARYRSFTIELEGHTAHTAEASPDGADAWDITARRANVARRVMIQQGVDTNQVRKVAGFADTAPLANTHPTDEVNQRVTVMLKVRNPR